MLALSDYVFYFLGFLTFFAACGVILVQSPIYAALFLAISMIGVSAIFVTLDAMFVAGVQLIVYAGAVMVLFVMVLMLFDLKHEVDAFTQGVIGGSLKLASIGVILGIVFGSIYMSAEMVFNNQAAPINPAIDPVKGLSAALFGNYIFAFEVIGGLLLVIAIGAVTLSRIRGGTHADE